MTTLPLDSVDVSLIRDALIGYQSEILRTAKWAKSQPHIAATLIARLELSASTIADVIERLSK